MRSDHLVLALLWSAYCAIHSALISTRVTNYLKRVIGTRYAFYRLFFNVFSLVTLVPLVIYSRPLYHRDPMLFEWSGNWRILQFSMMVLAALLIISGARHYSMSQFLGFRQIRSHSSHAAMTDTGDVDTTGVLGITRHPWYVAVFLLLWASDLNVGTIIVNLVLSVYLVIGTLLEERKLVMDFGDRYRDYQRNVSMFVPVRWPQFKTKADH
jgi:methanethiol S-methyltransferase